MAALFPLVFGGIAVLVAVVTGQKSKSQQAEAWMAVAAAHQLQFTPGSGFGGYGRLNGAVGMAEVAVDIFTRGSGDSSTRYTRYRLNFPSMFDGAFMMKKQKPFSIFGRLFGAADQLVGDPDFDSRVVVNALDPTAVNRYLTPARKVAVLRLMEGFDFVEVGPRSFTVERRDVDKDANRVTAMIQYLADVARVLSSPSDVDLALEKQERGDLADAVVALHELNDVQDAATNSFTQFLEAEALVAMGEGKRAGDVFDDMPVFDPELGEWKTVAKNHLKPLDLKPIQPPPPKVSTPPTSPPPTEPAPPAVPAPAPKQTVDPRTVSLDQDAVIEDLFGSSRLSFDVEKRFFEVYELARIEWTGTVQNSRNFRSDRDFPGAGVKATIEIGSRGDSKLVSNQVRAIVHFAEGTTLENGSQIRFSGTLIRADRYMRNLFVAGASLQ